MQTVTPLASQLQQINHSFIEASFYDPTTYYLGDMVFDRDEFKKLKKRRTNRGKLSGQFLQALYTQ